MAPVCTKVIIMRHAEKPDLNSNILGVTEAGAADKNELTVRGWQRAGALVRLFNPSSPAEPRTGLAVPGAIFAAPPTDDNPSKRPLHTVAPLAADLKIKVQSQFALHQEKALFAAALDAAPTVLICWHHERIDKIAAFFGVSSGDWPDEVFDRILILDKVGDVWKLTLARQRLLPGDS